MAMEVFLARADDDDPTEAEFVHKTATLLGERERLLHEVEVLQLAAQRGVTGLATVVLAPSADAPAPTLVTGAVAGPSLAVAPPLPVLEVAGVAAEVARLLAGLHEAGVVHGAVEPGHVVLDGAGGAILVSLGRGGEIGAASSADDASAARLDPAVDVAGWGALVTHLLDWSATGEEEPLLALRRALNGRPARRRRSRPPSQAGEDDRRCLAALADQAQDPDPAHRPSARSLAAAVEHRIPQARMPGGSARPVVGRPPPTGLADRLSGHLTPPDPAAAEASTMAGSRSGATAAPLLGRSGPGRPRLAWLNPSRAGEAAADTGQGQDPEVTGLGPEVSTAVASWRARVPPSSSVRRGVGVAVGVSVLTLAGLVVAGRRPASDRARSAPPRACPSVATPSADVDGDGCEETVQWQDGVLQAGVTRFALGSPGDGWALGDWDCDGQATPALLHDGALTVFDAWPGPGGELPGRPVAQSPGAQALSTVPGPDGCDQASISRPGAADLLVDPRATP